MNQIVPAQLEQHDRWIEARARLCPAHPPAQRERPAVRRFSHSIPATVLDPAYVPVFLPARPKREKQFTKSEIVLREVAEKHGVKVRDMVSADRAKPLVNARWEAFYRLRHEPVWRDRPMSIEGIGKLIGGRDHTTVLYGIRKFKAMMNGEVS